MKTRATRAVAVILAFFSVVSCTGAIEDPGGFAVAAGGNGSSPEPSGRGAPPPTELTQLAASSTVRRLSNRELNNTIAALVYDRSKPFSFTDDARTPFDNDINTSVQKATPSLIDVVEITATDVAARLLDDKARLSRLMSWVGCMPRGSDDGDCFRQFLTKFGRRALRRPLIDGPDGEIQAFMRLFTVAQEDKDFHAAVAAAVRMFLQLPDFVYRIEADRSQPLRGQPGVFWLNGYEMASRLSFLLWGVGPDDALLDLAQDGKLDRPEGVRATAVAMLKDARAIEMVSALHAMWLGYDTGTGKDMRTQTDALVKKVLFENNSPWRELLRSDKTYVNKGLATHYNLTIPPTSPLKTTASTTLFDWVSWGGDRMGLLSEGSFLGMAHATDEVQMVIRRGQYVRERLFCQTLPPKPPNVGPPMTLPTRHCKWDVMANHRAGACAGCHNLMDPIGFGLDGYDGAGAPRAYDVVDPFIKARFPELKLGDTLKDCQVHTRGQLNPNDPDDPAGRFSGPGGLARLLAGSPEMDGCVAQQVYKFAIGRAALDDKDRQFVAKMTGGMTAGSFLEMLVNMAASEAFHSRLEMN